MGTHTTRRSLPVAEEAQVMLEALRRVVQSLRVSGSHARQETGLSGAQLFVLEQLRDGPLSINALAARTHTHQSSVSAVVARLEEAGHVERLTSASDRRRTEATLTPRGRALLLRSPGVVQAVLLASFRALPARTRAGLAEGLVKLADGMGLSANAPMFFEELAPRRPPKRRQR